MTETSARRCTGLNVHGQRCARMVLAADDVADDQVLCTFHRRVNKYVAPRKVRCVANRADGERCSVWALKELVDDSEPLCAYHAGVGLGQTLPPDARRCAAVKVNGERCKRWVMKEEMEKMEDGE